MRLWTLHPRYLDPQGLTALWRETLLARKVLLGHTCGYKHHPQLKRFQEQPNPVALINSYLAAVHVEAVRRGYSFDRTKIGRARSNRRLPETTGQIKYEWQHLKRKLRKRNPRVLKAFTHTDIPEPHPLFRLIPGNVRSWEIQH